MKECLGLIKKLPPAEEKKMRQTLHGLMYPNKQTAKTDLTENKTELPSIEMSDSTKTKSLNVKQPIKSVNEDNKKDKTDTCNTSRSEMEIKVLNSGITKESPDPKLNEKESLKSGQNEVKLKVIDLKKLTKIPSFISLVQPDKTNSTRKVQN